jgi:hypothetical protein
MARHTDGGVQLLKGLAWTAATFGLLLGARYAFEEARRSFRTAEVDPHLIGDAAKVMAAMAERV